MIPLVHDFTGERVLVFGGGPVGARKARRFAREADVVVVSPTFEGDSYGDSQRVRAAPDPADVSDWLDRFDPALAVAATDSTEVNEAIERAADQRGILSNRADRSGARDPGHVVVPATVRDDPVVAAVSTGANSPVLSRHLRQELESTISGAGGMAELTGSLREELDEFDSQTRRTALRAVVDSDAVWKALDTESANAHQVAIDVIADATGDSL
ncbi:bifunctional precorrin-2 dehydrogenase/sirohydrochlorin ferrochelatase [Halovenus sp. WSH3]|uniref:precorrin-2 dehydrogenase n=1 Tax=Halovenus carboxidivorans TaxID=2692199 RepID=A0A6B0T3W3_9EURY|nr:bifunctional precorrin-2 dehydrogenase/sirohydrochlorin ferrochelatase [Halovenus carboxidivorans]MXR50876.1 bifunctional precorrin-2 dehydrogenase/sirohydrochlorin ferrochelatase [Halovenus carboxidivorans]